MPQPKKANGTTAPVAPSFGEVKPPKRHRKGAFQVSDETVDALFDALDKASADNNSDGWIGDNLTYPTMGKAQASSQRYRKALSESELVDNAKRIASRVWQDGDKYRFALRLRSDKEVEKLTAAE
jgi:hypothetical protein